MFILSRWVLKLLAMALCVPAFALAQAAPAPIKIALIEGLSGPFANSGEAVLRNLVWAVERVNACGGVKLAGIGGETAVYRPLALERYDSKGQNEEALSALKSADDYVHMRMQLMLESLV